MECTAFAPGRHFTLMMKMRDYRTPRPPKIHRIQQAPRSITAFAGLQAVVDFCETVGLPDIIERNLTVKKRKRGYSQSSFVLSAMLAQLIGGNGADDFGRLRDDEELRDILGIPVPAVSTANEFFNSFTPGHIRQLERIQRQFLEAAYRRHLDPTPGTATIDTDSTHAVVYGHQQGADRLYTSEVGFHPILAFRAETREVLNARLRRGHASSAGPVDSLIKFVSEAFDALPASISCRRFRGDSAFFSLDFLGWLDEQEIEFAITVPMHSSVMTAIGGLSESEWSLEPGGTGNPGGTKRRPALALEAPEVAECNVSFGSGRKACTRRVVVRRRRGTRQALFPDAETKYHVVVTNRSLPPAKVLAWSDGRANVENCVRELKSDLDALGCGFYKFAANAAWMHMGLLVYNVVCYLRLLCAGGDHAAKAWQARTWRNRFFLLPGYITRTGRRLFLNFAGIGGALALFRDLVQMTATAYGG